MDNIHKCIYMLISPTLECYIGQTKNVKRRFREHRRAKGGCRRLYNAINFYDWDNFLKVIIEVFDDDVSGEFIDEREIYWIKEHNTLSPNGYNLDEGGNGPRKLSEETRAKMSASHTGTFHAKETCAKISRSLKGRTMSQESRAKMSAALKGRTMSQESRAKMSAAQMGKKNSEQTRAKIRASLAKSRDFRRANQPQNKKVVSTCKETGTKRTFQSMRQAARTLTHETGTTFHHECISQCCRKKIKTYHGLIFEYNLNDTQT